MTSVYKATYTTDGDPLRCAFPTPLYSQIQTDFAVYWNQRTRSHPCNTRTSSASSISAARADASTKLLPQSMEINLEFSGQMSVRQASRLGSDIANDVAAAHEKGNLHSGLSPHNVIVGTDGLAKVCDFGDAALSRPMGRLPYFSPEQATGNPAMQSSDVYALGALLYHMLAGQPPFNISNPRELLAAHAQIEPESIRTLRSDLKVKFAKLIISCLEKLEKNRPNSMRELAGELEALADKAEGISARKAIASGEAAPMLRKKAVAQDSGSPDGPRPDPSIAPTPRT